MNSPSLKCSQNVEHRDEDTWGYYLLNLTENQGLKP